MELLEGPTEYYQDLWEKGVKGTISQENEIKVEMIDAKYERK